MDFGAVSWLGAILGGVAFFAFGALWYGPLFGKQWMAATGVTEESARESNLALIFGGTLVMEIVAGIGLAAIIGNSGEDPTIGSAVVTGLLVSLLIAVPVLVVQSLYERKQPVLFALNAGYNVVGFVIMGAIIGALQ
jgi:hypothetical protein